MPEHRTMRLHMRGRVLLTLLVLALVTGAFVDGGAEATLASPSSKACEISNEEPAWSPDGSKVAFTRFFGGFRESRELWVMNADGSNQRPLLPPLIDDRSPTWSPDGSKIAFGRLSKDGQFHVYVVNADGTGLRRLSPGGQPAWSPGGDKIAFAMRVNGVPQIHLMNPDGTGPQRLTVTNSGADVAPAWSPDGSKLAFDRDLPQDDVPSIYVMNADGSGMRALTNDRGEFDPSWSPDGSTIVFGDRSYRAQGLGLHLVNADGTNKRQLLPVGVEGDEPDWSRSGRIAFSGGTRQAPGGGRISWLDIYTVKPDGSDVRNLTQTDGFISGDLKAVSFKTAPRSARAGKRLTATLTVADLNGVPLELDLPGCRASTGGRALSVVYRGSSGGRVRCVWLVPRSAKGKDLRGTIKVESCGSRLDRAFRRYVRG